MTKPISKLPSGKWPDPKPPRHWKPFELFMTVGTPAAVIIILTLLLT